MNKKIRFAFIFIVIFTTLFAVKVNAQNGQNLGSLSLAECIGIAQENSPVAKSYRYGLIASQWQYQSFRADLLPSLTLSGNAPNYNQSLRQEYDNGVLEYFPVRQSNATAELSIDQNILYTGGTVSVSSGLTRLGIFEGEDRYSWQSTPLVVSYQQPLFQFNSLKWQNRLQPLLYKISKKEFVQNMENLAGQVTQNFFSVYLAKINLENAQFNVSRNDSIYNISKGRYNVGSIAENDLLQSELALRNAESSLTSSRIEYTRRLNDLKILLGYTTDVQLDLMAPDNLPEISVNIEKAKELAIENNSEALTYRLSEIQAKRDLAQAKGNGGFSATLNANYGLNQISDEFDGLYKNPESQQFVTVGFDIPIFNWGKQNALVNAARNQQQQVANSVEYQRKQFIQQVQYQVTQFLQLRGQALLAAKSDTIAQRRYDVAQNRYLIGKIDITNLFIAQNEKDQARQAYIQALRDFWTGWYSLRQLTLYDFKKDEPITYTL